MTSIQDTPPRADQRPAETMQERILAAVRRKPEWWIALILLVAMIGFWHVVTVHLGVPPVILPSPGSVLRWLVYGLAIEPTSPASLWYHSAVTAWEALLGFVIGSSLGIVLGMVLAHWKLAERVLYPYVIGFQSLPKIAIAPLLVIWFGFGIEPKVIVTSVITFFPLLVNSIAGYDSVDPDRIDLARACNATRLQIFWKIILPSSLPFIFAGLNMAVVLAILGAIVGEFVGAQAGLGVLLLQYNNNMQVDGVFAVLLLLGLFGFIASFAVRQFERYWCFWAQRPKNFGAGEG